MKKLNFNIFQTFVIILIFIGFLYFLNYKENYKSGGSPCSEVADDDRCNKRKECEWAKGGCEKWTWARGGKRVCLKYAEYCRNKDVGERGAGYKY